MNRTYHGNHFFILSKGNNAGKPLNKPCPNCFVVISKCAEENQLLYWLCYGLWQSGYFHRYLTGSVIPFLRLLELKSIVRDTRQKIETRYQEFELAIETLNKLLHHEENISKQLMLIKQVKKSVILKLLK